LFFTLTTSCNKNADLESPLYQFGKVDPIFTFQSRRLVHDVEHLADPVALPLLRSVGDRLGTAVHEEQGSILLNSLVGRKFFNSIFIY
jgi:hypothetical protein